MQPSIDMKNQQYTNTPLWPCYFHLVWRYAKIYLPAITPLVICLSLITTAITQLSHANTTPQPPTMLHTTSKSVTPLPSSFSELRNGKWHLSYNNSDLSLWRGSRNAEGLYKFKAQLEIKASIDAFLALFIDLSKITTWMVGSESVTLEELINDQHYVITTILNSPWPFSQRWLTTKIQLQRPSLEKLIILISKVKLNNINGEKHNNKVEIPHFTAYYELHQVDKNKLIISYYFNTGIGGNAPAHFVNRTLEKRLRLSFIAIKNILHKQH